MNPFRSNLLSSAAIGIALAASTAQSQPCASAPSTSGSQGGGTSVAQSVQKLSAAVNNLKSILGGKNGQHATSGPDPCSPSDSATTVSASAPAAAPAPTRLAQANANAPIPPTAQLSSSMVPPPPASGLDPSKLPDILGIHIGEPTNQVLNEVRKLYPQVRNDHGTIISGNFVLATPRYAYTNDPPYTSSLVVEKNAGYACGPSDCFLNDRMEAIFSGPPDTRVVHLTRYVGWPVDKTPTADTVKGALIKKYGQTYLDHAGALTWLFDEEGNPMPPFPQIFNGCMGPVASGAGPNPGLFNSYLGVTPNVTQGDLDRIVKARCGIKIWVQAKIGATSSGSVNALELTMNEIAADLRDAFAAENYIRQAKNAQGNQQLKGAQQQAAPKF